MKKTSDPARLINEGIMVKESIMIVVIGKQLIYM